MHLRLEGGPGLANPAMVDRLRPGDHVCWTFDDDDQRLKAIAGYLWGGLTRGQKVLYFTDSFHPTDLVTTLERSGLPAGRAMRAGQLVVNSVMDTYLAGGGFDPEATLNTWTSEISAAVREGWPALRVAGDTSWAVRGYSGAELLEDYEAQVNGVFSGSFAMALCLYDRRLFGPARLARCATVHPATAGPGPGPGPGPDQWWPTLRIRRSTDPFGLKLSGETDLSNRRALEVALGELVAAGREVPSVVIDLADLRFADGAGARMLLDAAAQLPTVRLVGCGKSMARLLNRVADGQLPGGLFASGPRIWS